jgi:hypothetical protein
VGLYRHSSIWQKVSEGQYPSVNNRISGSSIVKSKKIIEQIKLVPRLVELKGQKRESNYSLLKI